MQIMNQNLILYSNMKVGSTSNDDMVLIFYTTTIIYSANAIFPLYLLPFFFFNIYDDKNLVYI
jgi:hypothetical protein